MKKRLFVVSNDPGLRQAFNDALIVIYTVRLTNGEEVDVCDTSYASRLEEAGLMRYIEEAELDVVEGDW